MTDLKREYVVLQQITWRGVERAPGARFTASSNGMNVTRWLDQGKILEARRPMIEFTPGSATKPGTSARADGASRKAAREDKGPGAKLSMNDERLKRQGKIFNHSGVCGKLTVRRDRR